jgi:uncharacterized protein
MKQHIIFFLTLVMLAINSQAQEGIFYRISGNGLDKPSYLFGTYHLMGNRFLLEHTRVEAALRESRGVVVETVLDSSAMMSTTMMALMTDKKLSDLLTPSVADSLDKELQQEAGAALAMVDVFKPVMVGVMLSLTYIQKDAANLLETFAGPALDQYIATTAQEKGKNLTALETPAEQAAILYNMGTPEEQAAMLTYMLRNEVRVRKEGVQLLEAYVANDLRTMHTLGSASEDYMGDMRPLLDERNQRWMTMLPKLMLKESQFIAVGALHLAGEQGLVALLTKAGYTVSPLPLH